MKETSFLVECHRNGVLRIEVNASNYSLNFSLSNGKFNFSLFSSDNVRLSYDGNRLIDMHNLQVLKGNDAKGQILGVINNIKEDIINEVSNLRIKYDIPVKLLTELLITAFRLDYNEISCLDHNAEYLFIHLTNDFARYSSNFEVVKKLKISLGGKNGCIKAVINLNTTYEQNSFLFSSDCLNFYNSIEEFNAFLTSYKTLNEKYIEVINYLKSKIQP
ncbi:hypothetical protein V6M85_05390 [Sulfolobus tengchongensis]|uniref:Uncharacterized protein n=2 Tax=Sulfolobus tengchongensis TaxID=207809 RepID=A0AAX4L2U3_9CREN